MFHPVDTLKSVLRPLRKGVKQARRFMRLVNSDLRRFRRIHNEKEVVATYDAQQVPGLDCFVATMKGLYRIADGKIVRVLSGYFYGLTTDRDYWYVFERLGFRGRLIRFKVAGLGICAARQVVSDLSPGCHQIDFIGTQLYVADTYNNRILVFQREERALPQVAEYYPAGKLVEGRKSKNYVHLNSIWRLQDALYVVFHNETKKSGRNSEIVRLDPVSHEIIERIPTLAGHAHNILLLDGQFLYCDSQGGSVVRGPDVVYACDLFPRGLSVTDRYVVIGKSEQGLREDRERLAGEIVILNNRFVPLLDIPLSGMVQEIRSVGDRDYGFSNNSGFDLTATPAISTPSAQTSTG